jgi:dihydroorotate dehydrogenase
VSIVLYRALKPLLFRLDPERAHELVTGAFALATRRTLPAGVVAALLQYSDARLATECLGLRFANPVGLAAGFDKHGTLVRPMALLGFGHVEVGTVTPRAQPGNARPRMFRLPEDEALINRLGFNSPGMAVVAGRLRQLRQSGGAGIVVGANIGKNRDTALERAAGDYQAALVALAPFVDYITINISSPNTPGLRRLHERAALEELLGTLVATNRALPQPRPLLLKISPDEELQQLEEAIDVGMAYGVDGFVATNTTLDRAGLRSGAAAEAGGLSGRPLAARAYQRLALVYALTGGRLPLLGVGGIFDAQDAYRRIRAGASLVQLYTGLIYRGPGIVHAITRGLVKLLERDGLRSVAEAVGVDARA